MSEAKSVKEVLVATKWIIENVGWCQDANFRDKDGEIIGSCIADVLPLSEYPKLGSVCITGALNLVDTSLELRAKTLKYLNATVSAGSVDAMWFNDDSRTTKKKVLALVRRAIKGVKS